MFGLFRTKPNYAKIFASQDEVRKYLYTDRTKTSFILGDNNFINAWLDSSNSDTVTAVIKAEALNGDIPSLKQMIWLLECYYQDAPNHFKSDALLLEARTSFLQDRIKYCQKAIEYGLKDQSYYAMTSSVKLYNLYQSIPNSINNPNVQMSVLGIIMFAEMYINSGLGESELIQDSKDAITYYTPIANLVVSMVDINT